LNAIAVEAYKKYILVSLIQNGQVCFHSAFSTAVHVNAEPEDTLFLVNSPDGSVIASLFPTRFIRCCNC